MRPCAPTIYCPRPSVAIRALHREAFHAVRIQVVREQRPLARRHTASGTRKFKVSPPKKRRELHVWHAFIEPAHAVAVVVVVVVVVLVAAALLDVRAHGA
jgi:hypothetical protein